MKQSIIILLLILGVQNLYCQNKIEQPRIRIHEVFVEIQLKLGIKTFRNKKTGKTLNGKYSIFKNKIRKSDIPLMTYENYIVDEGLFNKSYKDNLWKTLYNNKIVKIENWNNGLIKGEYKVYNINRELLYETNFGKEGTGKYKDYDYKSGELKVEGRYINGKKEGEWCDYDENGNIKTTVYYKNGTPIKK